MVQKKRFMLIAGSLLALALAAYLGGTLGKGSRKGVTENGGRAAQRCAYDGTRITPVYQVDAYLSEGQALSFCSIYCATRWLDRNKERATYFTVTDEVSGERFDSSLAHYVESDVVTVREVNNRVHAFLVKDDALIHAGQYSGRLIENPFGAAFVLPKAARFDKLEIGLPDLPDSMPVRLAVIKPIFKENRLDVRIVPFGGNNDGKRLLTHGTLAGLVCDLPAGLMLAKGPPSMRIIKNVLRPNPYRPLFALVARAGLSYEGFFSMEGKRRIAVPEDLSFAFYADYYIKRLDLHSDGFTVLSVESPARAWGMLRHGEVTAALLRTPFTDMAMEKQMTLLADDRNLPWMSVLLIRASLLDEKTETVKRLIFALEQSVLALNLKPNEFRTLLKEQGGIPPEARNRFPMPIFEGANCPAPDEIEPVLSWLHERGSLRKNTPYSDLVDPRFLPNPEDVGLAFCCR
jgi:NitT/TauT family transport system substrate-binding protein